ncbi:hypothetical protein [Burkholderia cenocepacia]|uniref:hypothetical protein n=1 Tax=Burkholderia cenocepacia TaxID=95486 RepID=UPI001B97BE69|nr:hypothetical protein [Burkholderia cenocepacia]MBR7969108.1 hypothetical protein [Burkholderia cenocepacia]
MAEPPRIQLANTISSRDSTLLKDALLWNYGASKNTDGRIFAIPRFGVQLASSIPAMTAGAALGFFAFGTHLLAIVGSTFYVDGISQGSVDSTSPYQFTLTGAGGTGVFLKNNAKAYTWNGTTLAQVTDANYPATTVPGVAYMDGYVFVEDPAGNIWNSNLNTPGTWNALNSIVASSSADPGAAISRLYNYVIGFGQFSIGFFQDAGNTPPGSPLLPNLSAAANVGCASGTSVVATENTIFWVGQTHQKGRSVYIMNGLVPTPISDERVDRVLNADPLTNVFAYFIKTNGHAYYVLTLTASNVTLVYDVTMGLWSRWSSTALGSNSMNAVVSYLNGTSITLVIPNHGLTAGTVINVSSPNTSQSFLGTFVPSIIDANTISYTVGQPMVGGINTDTINTTDINADTVLNSAAGLGQLIVTPYVQNAFAQVMYAYANNTDYLLGRSDGKVYSMLESVSSDNGTFIYGLLRTNAGDFGSDNTKFCQRIEVIGDKVADTAYVGYSDDDFNTWSAFRPVNLGAARAMLRRAGAFRRRAFALLYIGGFQVRFYQLELGIEEGDQ